VLAESVFADCRVSQVVRQRIPHRRASHRENASGKCPQQSLQDNCRGLSRARFPFCHLTNSHKELKGKKLQAKWLWHASVNSQLEASYKLKFMLTIISNTQRLQQLTQMYKHCIIDKITCQNTARYKTTWYISTRPLQLQHNWLVKNERVFDAMSFIPWQTQKLHQIHTKYWRTNKCYITTPNENLNREIH